MKNKAKYVFTALITIALAAASAVILSGIGKKAEPVLAVHENHLPRIEESSFVYESVPVKERMMAFDDGGVFRILRFEFEKGADSLTYEIPLAGNDITIRWQNYEASPYRWEFAGSNLPKATLFAKTSEESIVLSIPALYYDRFDFNTIECIPELEKAAGIEQTDGGYVFKMNFEPFEGEASVGELWFYKFGGSLNEWSAEQESLWIRQDLYKNRRFCFDGYYFKTYESYSPYAENGFFRNAANFTGAQILHSEGSVKNLGYAMTMLCLLNQNPYGYWETGPMSEWLYNDYGIGFGFYDTRFSTDFARSLIYAYSMYGDEETLLSAVKYADFLIGYTEREAYTGGVIGDGMLVPDYWSRTITKKTHVSLNHQLAEINFLLEIFTVTDENKYREIADKMLLGIENTVNEWIMDDKNLQYALMYDASTNNMVDYPYLTYNDLFETKELLAALNAENAAIDTLMAAKREWMDENGVTGYKE